VPYVASVVEKNVFFVATLFWTRSRLAAAPMVDATMPPTAGDGTF
jgi:hypothetical protein